MNPPPFSASGNSSKDEEHLKLLSIFHYVLVVFAVLGMIFLFIHYMIFYTVFNNPKIIEQMQKNQPDQALDPREFLAIFKWFYIFMGGCFLLCAIGNFLSGWYIREKMHRTFSLFVGGLNCLLVPIGTVLGVFTIIVLSRESVRALYNTPSA